MTVLVRFVFAPQMIMERTMQKAGKEMEYSLTITMVKTEAEAAAIRNIAEVVADRGADPVNYLLAVKYIEALKEVASGQENKTVYLPYEASNMLGSLGGIKDLFGK